MRIPLPYNLKVYAAIGFVCFCLGLVLGFFAPSCAARKDGKPLSSIDSQVQTHEVVVEAPIKALDKQELRRRSSISKSVADNKTAEVLATGKVSDASGTRTVAAVLDTKTGGTTLIAKRPFAEWMSRNRIGLGYGFGTDGLERSARYDHTFGRLWELYGAAQVQATDSEDAGSSWRVMLWLDYQF